MRNVNNNTMRSFYLLLTFVLTAEVFSQTWNKTSDFISTTAYCVLNSTYIGTTDGIIKFNGTYDEWQKIGLDGYHIFGIYVKNETNNDTIVAATDKGIFYANETSLEWKKANAPELKYNNIVIKTPYSYSPEYYALSESGVYRSTNLVDWKLWILGGKNVVKYSVFTGNTEFFGFVANDGLYITADNGEKFQNKFSYEGTKPLVDISSYYSLVGGYKYYIILASENAIYIGNRDSVWYGKNSVEWKAKGNDLTNEKINWMTSDGKSYSVGTQNGFYTSTDSAITFTKSRDYNIPMNGYYYYNPGTWGVPYSYYSTTGAGIYRNGMPFGFSNIQTLEESPDGTIFAGTKGYGIYTTKDYGQTWTPKNTGLGDLDIRDIEFISNGFVYVATRHGIYRSNNNGDSWEAVNSPDLTFYSLIEGFPKDGATIFATAKNTFQLVGTSNNWNGGVDNLTNEIYRVRYHQGMNMYIVAGKSGLWKSETNYISWWKIKTLPSYSVVDLEIDGNRILALTMGTIYYSDDQGETWNQTQYFQGICHDLMVDKNGQYFVANESGIYFSKDKGVTWAPLNSGLINLPYSAMMTSLLQDKTGYIWSASKTSGIYRSSGTASNITPIDKNSSSDTPVKIENTVFNGNKVIFRMNSKEKETVTLGFYSIDGKQLILKNVILNQGDNQILFNIPDIKGGIYLLKIHNKDINITYKTLLH